MNMRTSLKAYQKISVNSQLASASPHKVVQMLFGGAMERLVQAKAAMEQNNIQIKAERITKAWDIIAHLQVSLSIDDGGEIAQNLNDLYSFMLQYLTEANLENNPQKIDVVYQMLAEIKSAWDQIPSEHHYSIGDE